MQQNYLPAIRRRIMHDQVPGTELSLDNRVQCKSLLLIYRGLHIRKTEYKLWITNEVFSQAFKRDVKTLIISRKTGPIEDGSYKCTYVIVCIDAAIRSCKCKIFCSWKDVQPEIRTLKNKSQVDRAEQYLQDWTCDPAQIIPRLVLQPVIEQKIEIQHPKVKIMYTSDRPLIYYVSDFIGWQSDVIDVMNMHADPSYRKRLSPAAMDYIDRDKKPLEYPRLREEMGRVNRQIHVVYCPEGDAGITTFLMALKYPKVNQDLTVESYIKHNPDRFLIIVGVPSREAFNQEADAERKKGWTGECVIFDLTHEDATEDYQTLEAASDESTCRSVWIFTKKIPEVNRLHYSRWVFYKIEASWITGRVSRLESLPLCKVLNMSKR